jgi:ABC-type sugar transport system substrate-binding protein
VALLNERQEFQLMQATDARECAARAGLEIEVLFAEDNAIQQIHQLFERIHAAEGERPSAIVVESVTSEGLERVARNAVKAGIGWVLVNGKVTYLDTLRNERRDLPIGSVSVDNEEVGRIQGRQLRALLPQGGLVLYLSGRAETSTTQERLLGAQKTIEGAGIELKILGNDDWTEATGERTVSSWLRLKTSEGSRPAVVCAQNDSLAVGARRSIRAHRPEWSQLTFTGCDGLPEGGQRRVRTGELTATIVTPTPAGPAVTLVARALAGERVSADLCLAPQACPAEEELVRRVRAADKRGSAPEPKAPRG